MLTVFLKALSVIGPVLAATDEVQDLISAASVVLSSDDQAELQELLDDLRDDRIAGHARLQAKLAEAAKR